MNQKQKSTLMLAILDEHLLKFHAYKDAKFLWEAIKNRFGRNKESKKMQKTILKENYENFTTSSQKGPDKTYDRFKNLISRLENHGEVISHEDVNLKLLRSLPSACNNIALIIRNKSDLDTLSMDDLYNNMKVYEFEIKSQSSSSSNSQNVAFVTSNNSSSTNETLNTVRSVSAASSKDQDSTTSYADDVMFSFFTNQSNALEAPRNQENRNKDAPRRNAPKDTSTTNALVVQDGIGYQIVSESLEARIVVHEKNEAVYKEGKITGSKEIRPVWNNTARVNHQSKLTHSHPKSNFVPVVVLTKSGQVPVNAANQRSHRAATSVSVARRVNTTATTPSVNDALLKTYTYFKTYSPICRPFNQKSAAKTNFFNEKANTAMVNNVTTVGPKVVVSVAKGNKDNVVNVSQMRDKKNCVLFTHTECVVLSPDFKLLDESQVLLKVPRNNNMYSFYLKNVVPLRGLTCLFAKATLDESNLWHIRLGHINFKTMNKLVRGNLVRGFHSKLFENEHTCVACQKGKQHKAPDETPEILKNFIAGIENQMDHKVKTIRCDNGTEFKNRNMNDFCEMKGRKPALSFMRPFGCPVTILNNLDHLEENLDINFLENKPNVIGTGPNWMFDINTLTMSMNYQPVFVGNQTNGNAGTKADIDAGQAGKKTVHGPQYVLLPLLTLDFQGLKSSEDEVADDAGKKESIFGQDKDVNRNSTYKMFTPVNAAGSFYDAVDLQDTRIFSGAYVDEVEGAVADFNNLEPTTIICPILTTRIYKDHPKEQIIRDPLSAPQTRRMTKTSQEHDMDRIMLNFTSISQKPGNFNTRLKIKRKAETDSSIFKNNLTGSSNLSRIQVQGSFLPIDQSYFQAKCQNHKRSYFPPTSTIPRRSKKQTTNVVEPKFRTIVEMADNRTMGQMLQAPIKGYEDAIVVPQINVNNFELKQTLINLVQSNQLTDKEPPRSTLTWEDLVSNFINQFFPPSKTTYLRNEITNFLQKPNETFNEAWERFKDLLRQCPHHGFFELHQLDTFYNALNPNDQDALDSTAGGNFLHKIPRECLSIIKSKSKVRYSRSRVTDVRANTNAPLSPSPSNSFDLQQIAASLEDKLDIRMNRFEKSLNDMKNSFVTPTAPLKAVEEVCVTCGANHSYNQCPLIRENDFPVFHDNIQQFQAATVGNFIQNRNQNVSNQMRPPGFNQPNQPNNQSRYQGNNFNQNQNRQNNHGAVYPNRPQQALNYQAPTQQNTVTHSNIEAYTNANDANMNNLQLKLDNFQKNQLVKEKIHKKDDILAAKFMEIFRDLHFELSFADALVHMPKFAPMFKKLLNNKNKLIELTKTPLNEHYLAVVLKKLPEKLDFVVLDFIADPRVPLILGRPFLSTAHAIVNVHEREIIIRQDQQSLTIQCGDIPSIKKIEQINKIYFINVGGIDFESEEIENFFNDDSIPFGVEYSSFNMEEDILFFESLLREDPIPPYSIISNQTKLLIEEPKHSFKMGHEHFNTNLVTKDVAESSTKNLIPILHECECDYLDEFYGPFIPIHILEEERIRREHADYINRMEMLFTINPHSHPSTYANTNVESFSSFLIPIIESDPRQEEIDVVSITNEVLPLSVENEDSDEEVDAVDVLRVDNFIQNSKHEYSESEDSDFHNPPLSLPPLEPPDEEFDFEINSRK
nr:ribonuclease H-like domain-containing protein [Tanacetum cinerariifolium]